ncbi:hypothetical protein ABT340_41270 [Streptosporangium sp. NPDC000239]
MKGLIPGRVYPLTPETYALWGASRLDFAADQREADALIARLRKAYPN